MRNIKKIRNNLYGEYISNNMLCEANFQINSPFWLSAAQFRSLLKIKMEICKFGNKSFVKDHYRAFKL